MASLWASFPLRPDAILKSAKVRTEVQVYRALCLVAAAGIPLFGVLRAVATPEATDPLWLRFGIGGICLFFFGLSYVSTRVVRYSPRWMWTLLYVLMTWNVWVASLNGFSDGYSVGVLLLFTVSAVVIGFQVRTWSAVVAFATFSIFVLGVAHVAGPAPDVRPLILFTSIVVITVVECIILEGWTRMHEELEEERDRFATLFRNLPTPVVHVEPDQEGRIRVQEVNAQFEQTFGYDEDEIREEDIQNLVVPSEDEAEVLRRRFLSGGSIRREVQRRTKNGMRDFELQVAPREGEDRVKDGFAIYTDVTERKKRERKLARRKALLEAQAESSLDGILVVDPEWNIEFYNDRFLEVWDVSKEEVVNPPNGMSTDQVLIDAVTDLAPGIEELRQFIVQLTAEPYRTTRDQFQLTDGRWLDRYSSPITGDDGTHFGRLWIFRDITAERKMQERLLNVQAAERRRINQEIQDEMGGLLASIQMRVDLARMEIPGADTAVEHVDQIEELVSDLANQARMISRKLYPSALADYGLPGTLPPLAEEMNERHDLEVNLRTNLAADDRFPDLVERTAYWIVQEGLVNVVRHAETRSVEVTVMNDGLRLLLHVADDGVGFRTSEEDSEATFGLEGIRRRVQRLDGDVVIESAPGEGTSISVSLPLPGAVDSNTLPVPSPKNQASGPESDRNDSRHPSEADDSD